MRYATTGLLLVIAIMLPCLACGAPQQEQLGKTDELRIVVDKVLMKANGWVMTEDHVRQIAEAGFNVVSPRLGNKDMKQVRKVASAAQKHGIFHMPWMRGTHVAKTGPRMVWANGVEQDLCSPNGDELWNWMTGLITQYAKISTEIPSLMGVFLDYENYSKDSQGNGYGLSYDDATMQMFAKAQAISLPSLAKDKRCPWLTEQGLNDEFESFQINHWRERCRALRKAVDSINPRFQFCIYPAPGTLFMEKATWPEWATEQAPLIMADASTYGRPTGMMPHKEALAANRKTLEERMAFAMQSGHPMIYTGGIDPVVQGADPEFCGKNALMCADATDGYWIFYEGPNVGQDHEEYWEWFTWANRAIVAGEYDRQYETRETEDGWGVDKLVRKTDKLQLGWYGMKPRMPKMIQETGKFEVHEVRGMSHDYLKELDVIVLQNFNIALEWDSEWVRTLRKYVEDGGALMLAHDTAWFMASPFPEIAVKDYPTKKVEAERHVVETDLKVVAEHPSVAGVALNKPFPTEFRDHMIFKSGVDGTVVVENLFGDPVYVAGAFGKGRVVFNGCYYGYRKDLSGMEEDLFLSMLDWLAGK